MKTVLMKAIQSITGIALMLFFTTGCQSLDITKLKRTDKYSAMGNQALLKTVENAEQLKEARNAARTLGTRILDDNEKRQMFTLFNKHRGRNVDIALIQSLVKSDARLLKDDITECLFVEKDPDVAVELAKAFLAFSEDDKKIFQVMTKLLAENKHNVIRFKAAKHLGNNYPEKSINSFADALKKEESSSVAELLCRILNAYGTKDQLNAVEDVANDTSRIFVTDKYGGKKMNAQKVRVSAVKAVESIKSRL